jgi:hypothetical protein
VSLLIDRSLARPAADRRCDYLVGSVTAIAERILEATPEVRVIAISRQPLRLLGRGGLADAADLFLPPMTPPSRPVRACLIRRADPRPPDTLEAAGSRALRIAVIARVIAELEGVDPLRRCNGAWSAAATYPR